MNAPAAAIALPARLLSVVFVPFAAGFFLSFMFRNANAVISKDLASEFSLSASELGLLTSAYFLAFAAMQIPVGIFLDRYGPRRVNATRYSSTRSSPKPATTARNSAAVVLSVFSRKPTAARIA